MIESMLWVTQSSTVVALVIHPEKMKHLKLFALLSLASPLMADVVFLSNGTVLENVQIDSADASKIQVTVDKVKKIKKTFTKDEFIRVRYSQDYLEVIYIRTNEDNVTKAYLIEQDTEKVLFRREKDSIDEETMNKNQIKEISNKEIRLWSPELGFHGGVFQVLNSGNAKLKPAPLSLLSFALRPPHWNRSLIGLEAGFAMAKGGANALMSVMTIPAHIQYTFYQNFGKSSASPFAWAVRGGVGGTMVIFNDGEGSTFTDFLPSFKTGVGTIYSITRNFRLTAFLDYWLILDQGVPFHNASATIGFSLGL